MRRERLPAFLLAGALAVALASCGSDSESTSAGTTADTTAEARFEPAAVNTLRAALDTAYTAASDYARANDNYYARTRVQQGELAAAVSRAFAGGGGVGSQYVQEQTELELCSRFPDSPTVRISVSGDGDDLILAAADNEARLTLTYEVGSEIAISEPEDCTPLR